MLVRLAPFLRIRRAGLFVAVEKEVVIYDCGREVGRHKLDLVVESRIIVELKTTA